MVAKFFAALCVTAAPWLGFSQAIYTVMLDQKLLGEARLTQKILPNGDKFVELVMTLKQKNATMEVRTESTFSPKGEPVREIQTVTPAGKPPKRHVVVTFDEAGANVVDTIDGVPHASHVPLVENLPRADRAEFWFCRDHPSTGATCKAYTFNADSLEWDLTESTFLGKYPDGFRVKLERSDGVVQTTFDNKGYPVSIAAPAGVKMVRNN